MAKQNKTAKVNIPMCIAACLFCLTLFSFYLCGGLYARYTTSDSGNDSARVAKFDVSEQCAYFSEDILMELTTPGSVEREISVTNKSEVAVAYTVTVKNTTQNIPYLFSINGSEPKANECSVTCHLEPDSDGTIKITAEWAEEGAIEYMGMVDLATLTISAQQVD